MAQVAVTAWHEHKNACKAIKDQEVQAQLAENHTTANFTNGLRHVYRSCDTKPPRLINGFIGQRSAAKSAWKGKKKANDKDTVCSTTAGPDGGSASRTIIEEEQTPAQPKLPSARKKRETGKKPHKKIRKASISSEEKSIYPQEEENWESEIQEVTITEWDKMHFGIIPYAPEDLLPFPMRDVKLKPQDLIFHKVGYRPGVYHPLSIPWYYNRMSVEPGQFADAQE